MSLTKEERQKIIETERRDVIARLEEAATMCENSKRYDESHTASVLRAQIGMIKQGLHERNLEEVPDFMGDITRFHQLFGLEYSGKPRMLPPGLFEFRYKFMHEEIEEYKDEQPILEDAITRQDDRDIINSLEKQLDGLVDEVYVVLGTAYLQFGPKIFNEAWRRVHAANMKKERAEASEDARSHRDTAFDVVKPEGWVPPTHRDLVEDHAHKRYRHPGQLNPGHQRDTQAVLTNQ